MRVLVCDDEPLASQRLADLLTRCGGVEVVGSASNGQEALDLVSATRPDLLLLDIEMPRFDGFDVVEALSMTQRSGREAPPLIIFVTAYPRFAAHAFDASALDFLTKPVRHSRLESALAKAQRALAEREADRRLRDLSDQLETLRAEHRKPPEPRHLWVQRRGEMVRVDLDQVEWVAAEGEYVRLHVRGSSYLHRDLLTSIMQQLDPTAFVRIHRSYAVNRTHVVSIRRSVTGGNKLLLQGGTELPIGRTYRRAVKAALLP